MTEILNVRVGSQNKVKVGAVEQILKEYPHLKHAHVVGVEALSQVSLQPKTLEETIEGAMNRAQNAFHDCNYSVGLESGLMRVPHTKSGYMDVCACAIYDGKEFHLGLSAAWEFPDKRVMELIVEEGLDMSQAVSRAGLTNNANIGSEEGAIGILTKGRVDRTEYTKQALRMALIHLEELEF